MDDYATNLTDRVRVLFRLAVLAVVAFIALGLLLESQDVDLPYYVTAPTAAAFFTAVYALYNTTLWRCSVAGQQLSGVPDLNGTWEGTVRIAAGARAEEAERDIPCRVFIEQTWARIRIEFNTPFTQSESSMAAISKRMHHPKLNGLRYEYHAEARAGRDTQGLTSHSGFARLRPTTDSWDTLEGEFFSDQGFHRWGRYQLRRSPDALDLDQWLASH